MFSHITIGSNDIERSRRFYDALFAVSGGPAGRPDERGRLHYAQPGGRLLVTPPVDGAPAAPGNGHTIGLLLASPDAVDAWHAAGVAAGGATAEDPPGIRNATGGRTLYLAYLRDPDGNKLCGFHQVSG